jgi:hypothetical protein
MTLTRRQFKELKNSCLYKAAFKLELNALANAAALQARPPRPNVRRDLTKALVVYECPSCHCFHVGHHGSVRENKPAFRYKCRPFKLVLAPSENL